MHSERRTRRKEVAGDRIAAFYEEEEVLTTLQSETNGSRLEDITPNTVALVNMAIMRLSKIAQETGFKFGVLRSETLAELAKLVNGCDGSTVVADHVDEEVFLYLQDSTPNAVLWLGSFLTWMGLTMQDDCPGGFVPLAGLDHAIIHLLDHGTILERDAEIRSLAAMLVKTIETKPNYSYLALTVVRPHLKSVIQNYGHVTIPDIDEEEQERPVGGVESVQEGA